MAADFETGPPQVSILIPARNEEVSLPLCLNSLTAQSGINFEILVVDDGSTDRTLSLANSYPGVAVVAAGALPAGWSGKCNAIMTGVKRAGGEWLLLTDADTEHAPGSLAAAVAEAQARGVDLLSYSPAQDIHGFWQSAAMPVIYAELANRYRPKEVSDPTSPQAAANGQYILVKRDAYLAVGGHARVAFTLLEDVALASVFKRAGRPIFFRFGGERVRTRMYRSFTEMRDGWTKNLALLFPATVELAMLRFSEFLLISLSAGVAVLEAFRGRSVPAALAGSLALVFAGLLWRRVRKAHFPHWTELLAPVGLLVFGWLLLRSRRAYRRGKVAWKGREYGPPNDAATPLVQIARAEPQRSQTTT